MPNITTLPTRTLNALLNALARIVAREEEREADDGDSTYFPEEVASWKRLLAKAERHKTPHARIPPAWDLQVRMVSDEFGEDVFNYSTLQQARAGYARLRRKIERSHDGIVRHLELVAVIEQDEITSPDEQDTPDHQPERRTP